jgi:hypothetical protein
MKEAEKQPGAIWWKAPARQWTLLLRDREEHVFLALTLLIGAVVGMTVVAFILLTELFGARLYPAGGAAWRKLFVPVMGSLGMGFLLYRFFPDARGSGVPQTKAALFAKGGRISLATVFGKFFCTSATLACGIPLGREGPAVQVGAGIASVLGRKLRLRPEKVKALVPVGAAAAIAAAFKYTVGRSLVCLGRSRRSTRQAAATISLAVRMGMATLSSMDCLRCVVPLNFLRRNERNAHAAMVRDRLLLCFRRCRRNRTNCTP